MSRNESSEIGRCISCSNWSCSASAQIQVADPEAYGECIAAQEQERIGGMIAQPMLASCLSEGIEGDLITHANFGCILYARRPTQ